MISLPYLPYSIDALEPHISSETMEFHYNKHHNGYVTNLNSLIEGTEYEDMELGDIVQQASGAIYNNAAQVLNHTFYFEGLSPQGGNDTMTPQMTQYLTSQFGSVEEFIQRFTNAGKSLFGSGWVWLYHHYNDGGIAIIQACSNGDSPFASYHRGIVSPLLCWDCWEHNYYIDHRNDRAAALDSFWKVVDWEEVTYRLEEETS